MIFGQNLSSSQTKKCCSGWTVYMQKSKVSWCLTVFKVCSNFCVWEPFPGQTVLLESLPTSFREGNKFYSNILSRLAELLQYSGKIRNIKQIFRTSQLIREVHNRQWRLEMRLFVSSPEIVQNYCFQYGDWKSTYFCKQFNKLQLAYFPLPDFDPLQAYLPWAVAECLRPAKC